MFENSSRHDLATKKSLISNSSQTPVSSLWEYIISKNRKEKYK